MQIYNKKLKPLSQDLRSNQTDAELLIWSRVRNQQILNVTFNRQKPIYNYILDFYCHKAKLAIELDGAQHLEPDAREKDQVRDRILLESYGIKTIRFTNYEVLNSLGGVMRRIYFETRGRLKIPPTLRVDPLQKRG